MAASPPYIPAKDDLFDAWLTNFDSIVAVDYASLGVTSGEATAITAATSAYSAALTAATDPGTRTPVTVAAKNTAKNYALSLVRPIAQRIAINPAIDPEDKTDLGLNPHTSTPTPVSPPTTFPVLAILAATPGQWKAEYRDSETPTTKAKPYGVVAMEIWMTIGDAPAADPTDAVYFGPATKSPFFVSFASEDAGKVATMFGRWRNRNGGVGPWSAPASMVIT